jgi:3'-5' exoribonuclease
MWDGFDTALKNYDFVKVSGVVGTFAGKLQATVRDMQVIAQQEVDIADFLPKTVRSIDDMYASLLKTIASIKNEPLKALLDAFFNDPTIADAYKRAPAAVGMHNAFIGGLLEHVVDMLLIAEFLCSRYPEIDRDMLLAGVILHDAAKIREYQYEYAIDYTDEGRLLGHITMGIQMIEDKVRAIPDFPNELRIRLEHLILSHHGTAEWGSPKQPMTLEAVVLHYVDNVEAKIAGFLQFAEKNVQEGTPWTTKAFMFDNRHLYIPQKEQNGSEAQLSFL